MSAWIRSRRSASLSCLLAGARCGTGEICGPGRIVLRSCAGMQCRWKSLGKSRGGELTRKGVRAPARKVSLNMFLLTIFVFFSMVGIRNAFLCRIRLFRSLSGQTAPDHVCSKKRSLSGQRIRLVSGQGVGSLSDRRDKASAPTESGFARKRNGTDSPGNGIGPDRANRSGRKSESPPG